jgi:hypothetical protein
MTTFLICVAAFAVIPLAVLAVWSLPVIVIFKMTKGPKLILTQTQKLQEIRSLSPVDQDEPDREEFLKERFFLREKRYKLTEEHDKQLLTLSTGALGLFITFIKPMVPHPTPGTEFWLAAGWISFGIVLISVLLASANSDSVFREEIRHWDTNYTAPGTADRYLINELNRRIERLNKIALVAFVLGFVFQASFMLLNLYKS